MTIEKLQEVKETVQEAFDEKEDLNCNVIGLYNYIRYANEDFGNDMIVNDEKPISDNSELQHCYLIIILNECIERGYEIPSLFVKVYKENSEKYSISGLDHERKRIETKIAEE